MTGSEGRARSLVVIVPLVLLVVPLGVSVASALFAPGPPDDRPFLEMPVDEKSCVVPDTDYMRYHHMELLKEVRNQVLRDGIRGGIDFARCQECHTSRERFCNRCHDAVSLSPDCFECHDYP